MLYSIIYLFRYIYNDPYVTSTGSELLKTIFITVFICIYVERDSRIKRKFMRECSMKKKRFPD